MDEEKKARWFRFLSAALIEPLTFALTQLLFTRVDGRDKSEDTERQKSPGQEQINVWECMFRQSKGIDLILMSLFVTVMS